MSPSGRNAALRFAALPLAALLLATAGCKPAADPAGQSSGKAETEHLAQGPDGKPGIDVQKARLVLPVIAGRPGAAYFTVRNNGAATATLVAVHVTGAGRAEMHRTSGGSMVQVKTLDIVPGGAIEFAPGGLHGMVFDIGQELKAGGTSEITLTFADGDKVSIPLSLESISSSNGADAAHGDHAMKADHAMSGMNH